MRSFSLKAGLRYLSAWLLSKGAKCNAPRMGILMDRWWVLVAPRWWRGTASRGLALRLQFNKVCKKKRLKRLPWR